MPNNFESFDFVTAWHLTDVNNIESIADLGLFSRAHLQETSTPVFEVGWDEIIHQRTEWMRYVLTFVTPYNPFTYGRIDWHQVYHPDSRGLCLIEIDLRAALTSSLGVTLVSSGNLAKTRITPNVESVENFLNVLDWHSMLDRNVEKSEQVNFARSAEILFPESIPPTAIRSIWVPGSLHEQIWKNPRIKFPVHVGDNLFLRKQPLPSPARHNFTRVKKLGPTEIIHEEYGHGFLIGQLGSRAIADFDNSGKRLIRFGSYDWP